MPDSDQQKKRSWLKEELKSDFHGFFRLNTPEPRYLFIYKGDGSLSITDREVKELGLGADIEEAAQRVRAAIDS